MQRGLGQVLFQFMPRKTFDNPDNNTIEQVQYISGNDLEDINEEHLVNRVGREVWNWQGSSRGYHEGWEAEDYEIIKPEHVISRVFPLVFRCGNCGRVHDYQYRRDDLKEHAPSCPCGSPQLWQIHHVMICGECSSIKPIRVPSCGVDNHGKTHIELDDSAERYKNFRWRCKECGGRVVESGLNRACDCDEADSMQPTVHRASKAYRVHNLKRVDIVNDYSPDDDEGDAELRSDLALGAELGLYDHPDHTIRHYLDLEESEGSDLDSLVDEDAPPEVQEYLEQKREEQWASSEEVQEILSQVSDLCQNDRMVSRTHYDYLQLLEETELEDAVDLVDAADTIAPDDYHDILDNHGLESIHLTSEFPILTAVYGYHRTFDDPEDDYYPELRAFPLINEGNCPIYASRSTTEAVLIKLDPRAIADWLAKNGLFLDEGDLDGLDDRELRARFHAEMEPLNPYTNLDDISDISQQVHGLMHTLSHVLIKEAAMLAGIEDTNLAEYLFPEAFTIGIYANQTQSFTIGGLYTLIERNLERWLATSLRESEYCIYDPICAEQGGSCHACTHISEIGCQFFNQNLSRGYLFDEAEISDGVEASGFWN